MSWQGYGAPGSPGYPQRQGEPHPPPTPRPAGGTGLVVLIVALAAVAALVFSGAGIWVAVSDDERTTVTASSPPTSPPSPNEAAGATAASPSPSAEPSTTVRPKVRGWTAVGSTKYRLAYDVPKPWQVNDPGLIIGFEDRQAKPLAAMSGSAEFKKGYCASSESSARAAVGFNGYVDTDLRGVAKNAARKWALAAYKPDNGRDPTVRVSAPRALRVGGMRAVHVTADATLHAPESCDPPRGLAHAVALPGKGKSKTTVFVIWADQGVSDAAADAHLRKMIRSLRPLP